MGFVGYCGGGIVSEGLSLEGMVPMTMARLSYFRVFCGFRELVREDWIYAGCREVEEDVVIWRGVID